MFNFIADQSPKEFKMTISSGYSIYGTCNVKEELSVKSVNSKLEELFGGSGKLVFNAKSQLRYVSLPCLSREKTIVKLREFPVHLIRKDLILPIELPISAQDPNSGFNHAYYKKVSELINPISKKFESNEIYLNKLVLAFGLYNEKFFNLISYDRVFKRYLYYFLRGASDLPSSFANVYCLAPKLDPSLKVPNAPFYLNRIVVCTPVYDVIINLKREPRFKDMDIFNFTGLEGKKLSGLWENIQGSRDLDRIDDVLLLPGGQVRYGGERPVPEVSANIITLYSGDEKWNWKSFLSN